MGEKTVRRETADCSKLTQCEVNGSIMLLLNGKLVNSGQNALEGGKPPKKSARCGLRTFLINHSVIRNPLYGDT